MASTQWKQKQNQTNKKQKKISLKQKKKKKKKNKNKNKSKTPKKKMNGLVNEWIDSFVNDNQINERLFFFFFNFELIIDRFICSFFKRNDSCVSFISAL